ncbi:MAG TPA: DJ-1/PfpI family protein [Chloroflexota bacterium]|nr:DJ-1/PfpI family protein [Chloroflexota bacterium]
MKVAFIIYDGMTTLDFIGVYDATTRLKTMGFMADFAWDVCALADQVTDGTGLRVLPTRIGGSLDGYDVVIVPGGSGARRLVDDAAFITWLQTAGPHTQRVSVCSGALLVGAAGFLHGKRATTHRDSFDDLRPFCAAVLDERIVDEGDVITARGVTSSIDLGLYLVEKLAGYEVKEKIRRQMDYQPDP